jgi:hypothetical protein
MVRPTSVVVEGTTQESTDVDNVVVIKDSHREAKESARMRQRELNGLNITTVSTSQQYDRFHLHSNAWLPNALCIGPWSWPNMICITACPAGRMPRASPPQRAWTARIPRNNRCHQSKCRLRRREMTSTLLIVKM